MKILRFLQIILLSYCLSQVIYSQSTSWKVPGSPNHKNKKVFCTLPLIFESARTGEDYYIGPEIPVTGASGFYDYQSIGDCRHQIYRFSSSVLHAVYMLSTDSLNINSSIRSVYCFSDNEGASWSYLTQVGSNTYSLFPSLTCLTDGSTAITTRVGAPFNTSCLYYDVVPGAGSLTGVSTPTMIYNPGCAVLSNGKILVTGSTMTQNGVTDTAVVTIFDNTTHTFSGNFKFKAAPEVNQSNMRMTYAAGPNGKALIVLSPINDNGGFLGLNRIFITFSTDFGQSWSSPVVLYNPAILNGQLAVPYLGLDAVYDNSGNYYVTFNTTDTIGSYSSAKLWITKNGGTPVLISGHSTIPEAANTFLNTQTGVCSIDNPSISVSVNGINVFITYSVTYQNDTLNGFNKSHIYLSIFRTDLLQISIPIKITNSGINSFDERFSSINKISPDLGGSTGTTVYLVYQKDTQPGSKIVDNAPISRSSLIFRTISGLDQTPGVTYNNNEIPIESALHQNYPNPFNPHTQITFDLNSSSSVNLCIFDVNGKIVTYVYRNTNAPAGEYKISFEGNNYASGVYFVSLLLIDKKGNSKIFTRKILLVK